MFVFNSTYEEALLKLKEAQTNAIAYKHAYETLVDKWNVLIRKINKKGGDDFINNGVLPQKTTVIGSISDENIRKLILLCHPDKHQGKALAVEMTQLLNSMKNN